MSMEYQKITLKEINGRILQRLEQDAMTGAIGEIGMKTTSNSAEEKYGWLGQVPGLREWKGARHIKRLNEFDYTLRNKKYETTLAFNDDDLDRDKTGQIDVRIAEMGERADGQWWELAGALIDGGDAAGGECYDGQYFFDTDHVSGDSGTQINAVAVGQVPALDVGTSTAPTAIEMSLALIGCLGYFYTYKDDQGKYINRTAKRFVVVCPTVAIYAAAVSAVTKMSLVSSGGGSVDNPFVGTGYTVSVELDPSLSANSSNFWLFRSDASVKPFIFQEEGTIETQVLGEDSDHHFFEDEQLFGIKLKRAAGYGLWQYAMKATLS